ncbi:hypothetical protein HBI52_190710 [Parastagonospora nodorum]|nr:hypothetical protein HBI10_210960 [Parastagonospora nodorum]KAH4917065.1 hypothetical protein HBI79_222890 [Parastagonospora nodorum]KAH5497286.1 hypothetical protein HBI52_190710 [Parastagonospora nodorum]KAH5786830.1 hypothetical protein HBI96_231830 [Parastagonospora nodorum]
MSRLISKPLHQHTCVFDIIYEPDPCTSIRRQSAFNAPSLISSLLHNIMQLLEFFVWHTSLMIMPRPVHNPSRSILIRPVRTSELIIQSRALCRLSSIGSSHNLSLIALLYACFGRGEEAGAQRYAVCSKCKCGSDTSSV